MINIRYEGSDYRWVKQVLIPALEGLAKVHTGLGSAERIDLVVLDGSLLTRLPHLARSGYKIVVASGTTSWSMRLVRPVFRESVLGVVYKKTEDLHQQFEENILPKLKRTPS